MGNWKITDEKVVRCVHGLEIYHINGKEFNVCVKCKEGFIPLIPEHHPQPKRYAKQNFK
jgi:hypothetical protein